MRFLQLLGTLVAAHFNGSATEFHFDRIRIQLAVASRTGCRSHDVLSRPEVREVASRPRSEAQPLSEYLGILWRFNDEVRNDGILTASGRMPRETRR